MRAGEARNREHIDIFLERGFDHLLGRLLETREHHFHPGLHARVREQFYRVDMPVESRLAECDSNFTARSVP